VVAAALVVAALGVAACSSNDNGGVITGTTQPTFAPIGTTSTSGPPASSTSIAPGGTLPSS
jgi:hypothetical protein